MSAPRLLVSAYEGSTPAEDAGLVRAATDADILAQPCVVEALAKARLEQHDATVLRIWDGLNETHKVAEANGLADCAELLHGLAVATRKLRGDPTA